MNGPSASSAIFTVSIWNGDPFLLFLFSTILNQTIFTFLLTYASSLSLYPCPYACLAFPLTIPGLLPTTSGLVFFRAW